MFDLSWQELFLIGVVALIVIGPKDMPQVMRSVAGFVRKARVLSREFQNGMAQMLREAELDELRRKVEEANRADVERTVKETVDPTGSLREDFDPTEFARQLKRSVEEPTIQRPAAAQPGRAAEHEGAAKETALTPSDALAGGGAEADGATPTTPQAGADSRG
jgi:sec-independent protein translocase protein TatB